MLGELAVYPVLIKCMIQTLKYKWSLSNTYDKNSLVYSAMNEMSEYSDSGFDCWLSRVNKMESLFNLTLPGKTVKKENVGLYLNKSVKSLFDRFYLDEINSVRTDNDGQVHNKLGFYATLKGSFSREPYIDLVQSRVQRTHLSRLRISASRVEVETQRYQKKPPPIHERVCKYCKSGSIGCEKHLIMFCETFSTKKSMFYW